MDNHTEKDTGEAQISQVSINRQVWLLHARMKIIEHMEMRFNVKCY